MLSHHFWLKKTAEGAYSSAKKIFSDIYLKSVVSNCSYLSKPFSTIISIISAQSSKVFLILASALLIISLFSLTILWFFCSFLNYIVIIPLLFVVFNSFYRINLLFLTNYFLSFFAIFQFFNQFAVLLAAYTAI